MSTISNKYKQELNKARYRNFYQYLIRGNNDKSIIGDMVLRLYAKVDMENILKDNRLFTISGDDMFLDKERIANQYLLADILYNNISYELFRRIINYKPIHPFLLETTDIDVSNVHMEGIYDCILLDILSYSEKEVILQYKIANDKEISFTPDYILNELDNNRIYIKPKEYKVINYDKSGFAISVKLNRFKRYKEYIKVLYDNEKVINFKPNMKESLLSQNYLLSPKDILKSVNNKDLKGIVCRYNIIMGLENSNPYLLDKILNTIF